MTRRYLGLAALVLSLAVGCSKPAPPTLTPRSAQVSAVRPDGVQLALVLAAHNPNGFPIVASEVAGNLELQDGTPLGTTKSSEAFTIPAGGDQDLKATLDVRFNSLAVLAPYALAAKPVLYRVRGSARIGSESLNVEVPFTIDGQITPEQVVGAGLHGAADLLAPRTP